MNDTKVIDIATKEVETKEIALTGGMTRAEITAMVEQFKTLVVIPDDKKSFDTCNAARMDFVHLRTSIEKNRLANNAADKATIQDKIDARNSMAKEIVNLFSPAEDHLTKEVDKEKARLKALDDAKVQAEIDRVNGIRAQIQKIKDLAFISISMASTEINLRLSLLLNTHEGFDYQEFAEEAANVFNTTNGAIRVALSDRLRWEEDQARAKAENDRLAKIAEEQAAERKRLDDERKAADDKARIEREAFEKEKKALQDEKDKIARDKQAELDRIARENRESEIREEARIKAEAEAKEKVEREAKEKADAEAKALKDAEDKKKADEAEKARREAAKPDVEKILDWLSVLRGQSVPEMKTKEMHEFIHQAAARIGRLLEEITKEAEGL